MNVKPHCRGAISKIQIVGNYGFSKKLNCKEKKMERKLRLKEIQEIYQQLIAMRG